MAFSSAYILINAHMHAYINWVNMHLLKSFWKILGKIQNRKNDGVDRVPPFLPL